jgi:hypothetical protein
MICTPHQILAHSSNEIKETGAAHSTYEGEKSCIHGTAGETWGKETTWKTQP